MDKDALDPDNRIGCWPPLPPAAADDTVPVPRVLLAELLDATRLGINALLMADREPERKRLFDSVAAVVEAVGPTREDGER